MNLNEKISQIADGDFIVAANLPVNDITDICQEIISARKIIYDTSRKLDINVLVNDQLREEIISLRQYKAEAESQVPVVEIKRHGRSGDYYMEELKSRGIHKGMKLYARPVPAGSCAVPGVDVSAALQSLIASRNASSDIKAASLVDDAIDMLESLSAIPSNSEGEKS